MHLLVAEFQHGQHDTIDGILLNFVTDAAYVSTGAKEQKYLAFFVPCIFGLLLLVFK